MIIELNKKKYQTDFISARLYREAVELVKENDLNDLTTETMDKLVGYIVKVFNNQFSMDDVYDYLPADELQEVISETLKTVTQPKNSKK